MTPHDVACWLPAAFFFGLWLGHRVGAGSYRKWEQIRDTLQELRAILADKDGPR